MLLWGGLSPKVATLDFDRVVPPAAFYYAGGSDKTSYDLAGSERRRLKLSHLIKTTASVHTVHFGKYLS